MSKIIVYTAKSKKKVNCRDIKIFFYFSKNEQRKKPS